MLKAVYLADPVRTLCRAFAEATAFDLGVAAAKSERETSAGEPQNAREVSSRTFSTKISVEGGASLEIGAELPSKVPDTTLSALWRFPHDWDYHCVAGDSRPALANITTLRRIHRAIDRPASQRNRYRNGDQNGLTYPRTPGVLHSPPETVLLGKPAVERTPRIWTTT